MKEKGWGLYRSYTAMCLLLCLPALYLSRPWNRKRVAIIGSGIVGLMDKLRSSLVSAGYHATTVCFNRESFNPGIKYDLVLGSGKCRVIYPWLLIWLLCFHHTLIYVSNRTLLPVGADWKIIRLLGRKSILYTCGCDTRHFSTYTPWAKKHNLACICDTCESQPDSCNTRYKHAISRVIDQYVDNVFGKPSHVGFMTHPMEELFIPLDLSEYQYSWHQDGVPRIVHAPSRVDKKGTLFILAALERLKSEGYQFDLQLFQGTPNKQVLAALRESQIVIDQLYAVSYGMFALESMALGNVVVSSCAPGPLAPPIIHATPDTIYEVLKNTLLHPEQWQGIANAGRRYVETYHDHKVVGRYLARFIEGGK